MLRDPYQNDLKKFKRQPFLTAANLFRKCVLPEESNLNDKALSLSLILNTSFLTISV